MSKHHHFINMYVTTTISVMLVLILIGAEAVLLLSADNLIRRTRENLVLDVVLTEQTDSLQLKQTNLLLDFAPYCHSYRYITQQEALEDHIRSLGEDPSSFLGYNPLSASYEVRLSENYTSIDSVQSVVSRLEAFPWIDKVVYQRDLIELMNRNISHVTIALVGVALVLLLISLVLIINTVRLQIYSKRFLINTMVLVGATGWHIRKPFLRRYALVGTLSALLAAGVLAGVVYYIWVRMGLLLFPLTWQNLCAVAAVLFVSGNIISMLAALVATGRYIRMNSSTMYEI